MDEFGQWAIRDFKGKIESEEELIEQIKSLEAIAENAQFPDSWSQYGGWKEKRTDATGFFRVEKEGKKWWMVDPDGYAFVSVGVDCVRPNSSGVVEGQEDLFKWLPENSGC